MAYRWELVCHHTYAGIPGVIPDLSPGSGSAGLAQGLADADFLTDGATARSGAVRFYQRGARVHVGPGKSWTPIGGVMGEVTLRRHPGPASGPQVYTVLDSDSFQLTLRGDNLVAWFRSTPLSYAEISVSFDAVGPPYSVPHGPWVRLGFLHDGLSVMELYADGRLVARRNGPLNGVASLAGSGLNIGNSRTGDTVLNGEIDEVKIWRADPARVDRDFFDRPWDRETADCWAEFFASLAAALERHPDCAALLRRSVMESQARLRRAAVGNGPQTRDRFYESSSRYRSLWRAGKMGDPEMAKLISEWIAWLKLVGISAESDPGLVALQASDCWHRLVAELRWTDCDPQVSALLQQLLESLGASAAGPSSLA
jgi:hypothetical protein